VDLRLNADLLHSVLDKVLTASEQYPDMSDEIERFIFDEGHQIRPGLCVLVQCEGIDVQAGGVASVVTFEALASPELIQFAHAVANGVVPHMPLRVSAATG
jgi:hypothetical protein